VIKTSFAKYFIAITVHGWRSAKLEGKEATIGFLLGSYLSLRCLFVRVIIDNADYEQMNIKQCLNFFVLATTESNDLKCKDFFSRIR
jgi:hypothetical protein